MMDPLKIKASPVFLAALESWRRLATAPDLTVPKEIAVGLSGGADSMALLMVLWAMQSETKEFSLKAIHINYGLRGNDSDLDEQFVYQWCERLQIPITVYKVQAEDQTNRQGKSLQEWCRDIRKREFSEFLMGPGTAVALAHHNDDLVETILFRLIRGFSLEYLQGMMEYKDRLWRPFLQIDKALILNFLGGQNIPHRHDLSNDKMIYSRNQIRLGVLPVLDKIAPSARSKLLEMAHDASELMTYVKAQVAGESKAWTADGQGLRAAWMHGQSRIVGATAVSILLQRQLGEDFPVRRDITELVWQLCQGSLPKKWETLVSDWSSIQFDGEVFRVGDRTSPQDREPLQYRRAWGDLPLKILVPGNGSRVEFEVEGDGWIVENLGREIVLIIEDFSNAPPIPWFSQRSNTLPRGRRSQDALDLDRVTCGNNKIIRSDAYLYAMCEAKAFWMPGPAGEKTEFFNDQLRFELSKKRKASYFEKMTP